MYVYVSSTGQCYRQDYDNSVVVLLAHTTDILKQLEDRIVLESVVQDAIALDKVVI